MYHLKELNELLTANIKLGEIRKIAKEIKKNHPLAMDLWQTGRYQDRALSLLIMDKNQLDEAIINRLVKDLDGHADDERKMLMDWLFANQLMKAKKHIALIESWQDSTLSLQRRTFWYYQARLRWMGKTPPNNTEALLTSIEETILLETPEVQWAMNFLAGWIGVYEDEYQQRCINLGEQTQLYKGQKVSKGCTPDYLPDFIAIERGKRGKN